MERRSLKRIQVPGAKVRLKKSSGLGVFNLLSKESAIIDISKSGLSFEINDDFHSGDIIYIRITFPDGKSFNLKGKIRWFTDDVSECSRVGIQFHPFGSGRNYNSLKALEYLRNMDGQKIEIITREPEEETEEETKH